jgi:SAM-dependent methyltransferase
MAPTKISLDQEVVMPFNLDQPQTNSLDRITRFSGWFYGDDGALASSFRICIDGNPLQSLGGVPRLDVGIAFPDIAYAGASGFMGDLVVPDDIPLGATVEVTVYAELPRRPVEISRRRFLIGQPVAPLSIRSHTYDLATLLEDPETGERGGRKSRGPFDPARRVIVGTPHFHPLGGLPWIRLLDQGPTHPYGKRSLELIDELHSGCVFLDLGCGIKDDSQLLENAVLLDAVQFRNVDIVNTCARLPFSDRTFDLVISQAVFEHVPDPFAMAREIFRVLKPGGNVLIDTAFMQPLHGDPNHYFNMTMEGLRVVLRDFDILDCSIQSHQLPSCGLSMQFGNVLPYMKEGDWKTRFRANLEALKTSGPQLDADLGPLGSTILAAGVSAIARRP